jgi:predicted nucleic acid-binding protein
LNKEVLFLDSCVFIDALESERYEHVINHAHNDGHPISTSITVLGETLTQLMEAGSDVTKILKFKELLDEWEVSFFFPNDMVRIICYHIGDELKERDILYHQITDRTHLAYSTAYKTDVFLTSDKALKEFIIPQKLNDRGFYKPETMSVYEFNKRYLMKKH